MTCYCGRGTEGSNPSSSTGESANFSPSRVRPEYRPPPVHRPDWVPRNYELGQVHSAHRPLLAADQDIAPITLSPLRRQNPREEPGALAAHAGICAGGGRRRSSLPRPLVAVQGRARLAGDLLRRLSAATLAQFAQQECADPPRKPGGCTGCLRSRSSWRSAERVSTDTSDARHGRGGRPW